MRRVSRLVQQAAVISISFLKGIIRGARLYEAPTRLMIGPSVAPVTSREQPLRRHVSQATRHFAVPELGDGLILNVADLKMQSRGDSSIWAHLDTIAVLGSNVRFLVGRSLLMKPSYTQP